MFNANSVTHANQVAFPCKHPVSVIASYNHEGQVRIDAWGIEFNGQRFRYTVESSNLIEDLPAYLKFNCLYTENSLLKSINLIYFSREHRWVTE